MELITRDMPLDYTLIDSSDYHYGALNCSRDAIRAMIDKVATKRNYFLANKGDSIEAITPDDKRFASCSADVKNNLLTPQQQADALITDFLPIRKKIVAWGHGNHEYKLINTADFGKYIAGQLGVPYGSVAYKFIAAHKGETMHKFYLTHGYGSLPRGAKDPIQREANVKAALRRKLENTGHADCIYMSMGHTHQLITVNPTIENQLYLTDDGNNLKQHYRVQEKQNKAHISPDSRWFGCSGSFLKLYSPPGSHAIGYAEVAMYGPGEIGWLEVHVQGGQVVAVEKVVA